MSRAPAAAFAAALALAAPAHGDEVVVFAAASLKNALDAVAAGFQAETGHTVTISYGGSNQLAKQIIEGAPADILISASESWMDEVEGAGLVVPGERVDLLGNTLVLVAHDPAAATVDLAAAPDLVALLGGGKLAMAMVDSVPAGQYGKDALVSLGLWEGVAPHVAQSENVRAALKLVSTGEAPFGIVYASDAIAEPAVRVVGTFPEASHAPIVYPAALLTGAADRADREFYMALSGDAADAAFAAQGFETLK